MDKKTIICELDLFSLHQKIYINSNFEKAVSINNLVNTLIELSEKNDINSFYFLGSKTLGLKIKEELLKYSLFKYNEEKYEIEVH